MPPSDSSGASSVDAVGDRGEHVLGGAEQLDAGELARQAGEVDGDAGEGGAGQAGEAARRLAGLPGQHAFAAVAEVDREQQLDRQARRVLAERRGGRRVAEQDAVGDLGRRRDLVGLRRAQQGERREGVSGEPHERGQARIGEAGAAGLEHRLPDGGLAVDGLGHADELDAAREQALGEGLRRVADCVEIEGEPGVHGRPVVPALACPGAGGTRPLLVVVKRTAEEAAKRWPRWVSGAVRIVRTPGRSGRTATV